MMHYPAPKESKYDMCSSFSSRQCLVDSRRGLASCPLFEANFIESSRRSNCVSDLFFETGDGIVDETEGRITSMSASQRVDEKPSSATRSRSLKGRRRTSDEDGKETLRLV
ncbi:hypothetical protein Tco_0981909 [Tanacetum coccineum]